MLKLYKNIDNPSKPPFNPPKGGFSSFAPRYSSSKLDSTLGLASVERGGFVASLRVQKLSGFDGYAEQDSY